MRELEQVRSVHTPLPHPFCPYSLLCSRCDGRPRLRGTYRHHRRHSVQDRLGRPRRSGPVDEGRHRQAGVLHRYRGATGGSGAVSPGTLRRADTGHGRRRQPGGEGRTGDRPAAGGADAAARALEHADAGGLPGADPRPAQDGESGGADRQDPGRTRGDGRGRDRRRGTAHRRGYDIVDDPGRTGESSDHGPVAAAQGSAWKRHDRVGGQPLPEEIRQDVGDHAEDGSRRRR
ncbi:hypothetical protein GBAR_LOCUS23857 [Geodia barretti]|uniref:Uncharacterized protein n=2 Tax=Geodia barretti TaxID=519541 RepID=A0AA35T910_GEOBA|nr:hypothetical protein GBAR_LOCUS23857 [Geodia barretti]